MTLRPSIPLYQQRGSVVVLGPASEPVTAAELRTHLRVDSTELPDAEANALIAESRQMIEDEIGLSFIYQTWRLMLDRWPGGQEAWWDGVRQMAISELYAPNYMTSVPLPRWPLASITTVTVFDEDSNSQAVTVSDTFDIDTYQVPGRITLKRGSTWPIALRANNAIQIIYISGYPNAAAVPATLKRALKQLAAFLYTNRGDNCSPADAMMKSGADQVLAVYRPMRV
jgi:uncharacterized phiE125 gp8 family phage protein